LASNRWPRQAWIGCRLSGSNLQGCNKAGCEVPLQHFTRLAVWEKARALCVAVYRVTQDFPRAELYGLTGQIRRAAVSVSANIAEGRGRMGDGDFCRFLRYALGSATELESHLLLARDLSFVSGEEHLALARSTAEVQRMLASLVRQIDRPRRGRQPDGGEGGLAPKRPTADS
jgi:four helix bundle protein